MIQSRISVASISDLWVEKQVLCQAGAGTEDAARDESGQHKDKEAFCHTARAGRGFACQLPPPDFSEGR